MASKLDFASLLPDDFKPSTLISSSSSSGNKVSHGEQAQKYGYMRAMIDFDMESEKIQDYDATASSSSSSSLTSAMNFSEIASKRKEEESLNGFALASPFINLKDINSKILKTTNGVDGAIGKGKDQYSRTSKPSVISVDEDDDRMEIDDENTKRIDEGLEREYDGMMRRLMIQEIMNLESLSDVKYQDADYFLDNRLAELVKYIGDERNKMKSNGVDGESIKMLILNLMKVSIKIRNMKPSSFTLWVKQLMLRNIEGYGNIGVDIENLLCSCYYDINAKAI